MCGWIARVINYLAEEGHVGRERAAVDEAVEVRQDHALVLHLELWLWWVGGWVLCD